MYKSILEPIFPHLVFEINDTYDTVEKACKARLDLFNFCGDRYAKFLYLDTDILIRRDLRIIFTLCEKDKLYVLEELSIHNDDSWYGGYTLFGDSRHSYEDPSAFSSGIMLFNNSPFIKKLFEDITNDINNSW